jgi:aconitate hydratase
MLWNGGWFRCRLAAAGEPYYVKMPKIMGIKLIGKLPNWVSAKDRLEMLRRYNVTGGRGYILEYYGPGLKNASAWDRHVIAIWVPNWARQLFPSDDTTLEFLKQEEREDQWVQLEADEGATYDKEIEIDFHHRTFNCTSGSPVM